MTAAKKRILVCPLDWGLGHATRCIPIINQLVSLSDVEVVIGASEKPAKLLKKEFPLLQHINFPGYQINYGDNLILSILRHIPDFVRGIKQEHELLDNLINVYKIDGIISDNRYGAWSDRVPSVFITHQLRIRVPFGKWLIKKINRRFINKFNFCWVPDMENNVLASNLSRKIKTKTPIQFIGPLSRFNGLTEDEEQSKIDVLGIISGPEPQRTKLEQILIKEFESSKYNCAIILGHPDEQKTWTKNNITYYNHLDTSPFFDLISNAGIIVCRSGYSSIMDLAEIGKTAILIPTPQQTEQEYLARFHHKYLHYYSEKQSKFKLERAIERHRKFTGIFLKNDHAVLKDTVNSFVKRIKLY